MRQALQMHRAARPALLSRFSEFGHAVHLGVILLSARGLLRLLGSGDEKGVCTVPEELHVTTRTFRARDTKVKTGSACAVHQQCTDMLQHATLHSVHMCDVQAPQTRKVVESCHERHMNKGFKGLTGAEQAAVAILARQLAFWQRGLVVLRQEKNFNSHWLSTGGQSGHSSNRMRRS